MIQLKSQTPCWVLFKDESEEKENLLCCNGCYFIIGLQDRYGIGDSIGGAQLTMEEVWIVQTGNFTLNGLVLLLFCNFFGKVKVVLEPQDMLADLIRVLAFA